RRRPVSTQATGGRSSRTDLQGRRSCFTGAYTLGGGSTGGYSMIAATVPIQRPGDARLLIVDSRGEITDAPRSGFPTLLHPGDVVIANDAATLPASLFGIHNRSGRSIEVRLAGGESVRPDDVRRFSAVVFGEGDYHTPTERRPSPPELHPGDTLQVGPLKATVLRLLGHPRLVSIRFEGHVSRIWEGLARYGRPIQYSYIPAPL